MSESIPERYKFGHQAVEAIPSETAAPAPTDAPAENRIPRPTEKVPEKKSAPRLADQAWQIVMVKSRIDATSQPELVDEIQRLRAAGSRKIALNLRQNRFLSFPAIRFCVETAREMREVGATFALVSCSEKTKRHFEIYGTLNPIQIVRDESDLLTLRVRDFDV